MINIVNAGYICKKCGMDVTDVVCRERDKDEDVINYTHHVGRMCGENHRIRSPLCRTEHLDIKLPITQAGIGFAGAPLTPEQQKDVDRQLKGD